MTCGALDEPFGPETSMANKDSSERITNTFRLKTKKLNADKKAKIISVAYYGTV